MFAGRAIFASGSRVYAQLPRKISRYEIKESKDGYNFKADVPGVKERDVEVTVTGNRLTVSGKREAEKEEQNDTYYTYERSYGEFARSFTLPERVDMNSSAAPRKSAVRTRARGDGSCRGAGARFG